MRAHCDAELGGRQMKRPIASLLAHLLAAFVIVSFSATPADTRTICKGSGDSASFHSAKVGKRERQLVWRPDTRSTRRCSRAPMMQRLSLSFFLSALPIRDVFLLLSSRVSGGLWNG